MTTRTMKVALGNRGHLCYRDGWAEHGVRIFVMGRTPHSIRLTLLSIRGQITSGHIDCVH